MILVMKGHRLPWLRDGDLHDHLAVVMAERVTFHRLLLELIASKKLQLWDRRDAHLLALHKLRWVRNEDLDKLRPI